jgi:hypothetical protein
MISGVCERDIDLLLLEEFQAESGFTDWFVQWFFGDDSGLVACIAAKKSVTQSTGESDLEVDLAGADGSVTRMMIENKVGAGLQPQQAERYRQRGEGYMRNGVCSAYWTTIAAPRRYFGSETSNKGFNFRLDYEDLVEWFQEAKHLGNRRDYKIMLLQSAIEKGTLGYQPVEDAAATQFWHLYWETSRSIASVLELKEPGGKPPRSGRAHYLPPDLPAGTKILHKLRRSVVDLQLRGLGPRTNAMHERLQALLEPDMSVTRTSKSAVVRLAVPKIEPQMPFEPQVEDVRTGIEAALRLYEWALRHRSALEQLREERAE